MNYYKIREGGKVVDANFVFLRFQPKHRILITCPAEKGEFIQSYDGEKVYRAQWLNPPPTEAGTYPMADADEIGEIEYLTLRKLLDEGLQPENEEPTETEPESGPESPQQEELESVMTVDEMRREISRLKDENNFLSECLLEMSAVVYA